MELGPKYADTLNLDFGCHAQQLIRTRTALSLFPKAGSGHYERNVGKPPKLGSW